MGSGMKAVQWGPSGRASGKCGRGKRPRLRPDGSCGGRRRQCSAAWSSAVSRGFGVGEQAEAGAFAVLVVADSGVQEWAGPPGNAVYRAAGGGAVVGGVMEGEGGSCGVVVGGGDCGELVEGDAGEQGRGQGGGMGGVGKAVQAGCGFLDALWRGCDGEAVGGGRWRDAVARWFGSVGECEVGEGGEGEPWQRRRWCGACGWGSAVVLGVGEGVGGQAIGDGVGGAGQGPGDGGRRGAVAYAGQVGTGVPLESEQVTPAGGGEEVTAEQDHVVQAHGAGPGCGGGPGECGLGVPESGRRVGLAEGGEDIVGEGGRVVGARGGVDGQLAGGGVVGRQGGVAAGRGVAWVEREGDGGQRAGAHVLVPRRW